MVAHCALLGLKQCLIGLIKSNTFMENSHRSPLELLPGFHYNNRYTIPNLQCIGNKKNKKKAQPPHLFNSTSKCDESIRP